MTEKMSNERAAVAWEAVCMALDKAEPSWRIGGGALRGLAVEAINRLALRAQPANGGEAVAINAAVMAHSPELLDTLATPPQPAVDGEPDWRDLCRRLYVELHYCDQQMTAGQRPKWTTGPTVRAVLDEAKAALAAKESGRG